MMVQQSTERPQLGTYVHHGTNVTQREAKIHCLLAEDDPCTMRVVQQLLLRCGYTGVRVNVQRLAWWRPDALFADVCLSIDVQ